MTAAIHIHNLSYRYPRSERAALDAIDLEVHPGERFALLGPNGCGKTTLFRLLSTLLLMQQGSASIFGHDVAQQPDAVRHQLGVVFQSPSLDSQLTARENLTHHGRLYGLRGRSLQQRIDENLERFGITDLANSRTGKLSGGQKRRIELAKALLHQPKLLLMDEPSTGLDPAARRTLWQQVDALRQDTGLTVAMTSHLMDEADTANRVAILNEGKLIAIDSPAKLKQSLGGDVVIVQPPAEQLQTLAAAVRDQFAVEPQIADGAIRFESTEGAKVVATLIEQFADRAGRISVGPSTLDDVFAHLTGQTFGASESVASG